MRIETDPARVEKLAAQRRESNWAFRRFLKESDIASSRIDSSVRDLYAEVSGQIDCKKCANCCKKMSPCMTRADIRRLANRLGLRVASFKDRFLRQDEGGEGLILKSLPCPFLRDNTCTVYDIRPRDCRLFPNLHKRGFVFRLIGMVHICSVCPIVFGVFEGLKRRFRHTCRSESGHSVPESDLF